MLEDAPNDDVTPAVHRRALQGGLTLNKMLSSVPPPGYPSSF